MAIRYIDTAGLPSGYDADDLIATGVTSEQLIAWMKPRIKPGIPPLPATQTKKRPASPEDGQGVGPAADTAPPARPKRSIPSNVVPLGTPAAARKLDAELDGMPVEYSDDSLATQFAAQYHEGLIYVAQWSRWMLWTGDRWSQDDTQRTLDLARMVCREAAEEAFSRPELKAKARTIATSLSSARTISNISRIAQSDRKIAGTTEQWDSDPLMLNTPGGIVDLRTGIIRAARKSDYATKITRVAPGGDCPLWRASLKTWCGGDMALVEFLQRVAGYCLTGDTREQKFFFLYGSGANGKSTFINTLDWILNSYSQTAGMELFTEQRFSNDRADLAGLNGARMVTAQETEEGKRWNEARVTSLTGGEPITAKFLYSNPFTFTPQFKLLFAGNHKPTLRSVNEAIMRRLLMVPFIVTVEASQRDPGLPAKLRAEAGGILQWAIDGCRDWLANTLAAPAAVLDASKEYFKDQDILSQFMEDRVEFGINLQVKSDELYKVYAAWCEGAGEHPAKRKQFLEHVYRGYNGISPRKSGGVMVIDGLRVIKTESDREF